MQTSWLRILVRVVNLKYKGRIKSLEILRTSRYFSCTLFATQCIIVDDLDSSSTNSCKSCSKMAKRYTYSRCELEHYFDRVCMPRSRRVYDVTTLPDIEKLTFLRLLHKHQLVKVPWENLTQHYSWHKVVNVKPAHLFKKIVNILGRGGYCMEVNYFYHLVLYSLGFDVYMAGSRIYCAPVRRYGGWTHVVNLAIIGEKRYLLDVGFGGQGPSRPVPVEHGVETEQIAPAQSRLMYEATPQNLDRSQRVWVFQHRQNADCQWNPKYCFVELEFTPEDIESMNFEPWLNKHTMFTHKVVAVRFTTVKEVDSFQGPGSPSEEALEGEIDGSLTINHDVLKWRRHGGKAVEMPFKKEEARVAALERYFGIAFADEDREAILNTVAEISVRCVDVKA